MARINWTVEKGHLGADPEISVIKDNRLMAKVSIAVNRYRKDEDGEWEELGITSWINATAFGYAAELIEAMELEKGDAVFAEGQMYQQEWYDEEFDEDRISWEYILDRLFLIPSVFEEEEEETRSRSKKRSKRGSRIKGRKSKSRGRKSKKSSRSKKRKPKIKKKKSSGKSDIAKQVAKQLQG